MKRIVTITIEGEVPDTLHFGHVVADILDRHAADIRDRESIAGQKNTGSVTVEQDGGDYRVSWIAEYGADQGSDPIAVSRTRGKA